LLNGTLSITNYELKITNLEVGLVLHFVLCFLDNEKKEAGKQKRESVFPNYELRIKNYESNSFVTRN
jgi:hypothetical protein